MTTIPTALLDHWNTMVARRLLVCGQPVQGDFYTGVMYGIEVARDDLAAALPSAMAEVF